MGIIDGQIGDRVDDSTTNIHVFEFHESTAFSIIGFGVILLGITAALWFYCRRKYRRKHLRNGRQLAITYQGCTCGALTAATSIEKAAARHSTRSRSRSPSPPARSSRFDQDRYGNGRGSSTRNP